MVSQSIFRLGKTVLHWMSCTVHFQSLANILHSLLSIKDLTFHFWMIIPPNLITCTDIIGDYVKYESGINVSFCVTAALDTGHCFKQRLSWLTDNNLNICFVCWSLSQSRTWMHLRGGIKSRKMLIMPNTQSTSTVVDQNSKITKFN